MGGAGRGRRRILISLRAVFARAAMLLQASLLCLTPLLDSLPEPKISCNASDGKLVLNCTAHFQGSLNYSWKLSDDPHSHPNQVVSIPLKNVDTITKAICTIKFSQTERSSEISLIQCLQEEKGDSSSKRNRGGLIGALIASIIPVGIVVFLLRKGVIKRGAGRAAHNNSPVNGSGEQEQLFPGKSQQQPNSEAGSEFLSSFSKCAHADSKSQLRSNIG
uniref:Uncharacterized protein n=1 Tax=Cyanoderma ruficeps TaxID=181631 RepID=A0A8C3P4M4_9PASS